MDRGAFIGGQGDALQGFGIFNDGGAVCIVLSMEEGKPQIEWVRRLVSLASSAEKIMPAEQAKRKAETDWKAVLKWIDDLETGCIRLALAEEELRSCLEAVKKENTFAEEMRNQRWKANTKKRQPSAGRGRKPR